MSKSLKFNYTKCDTDNEQGNADLAPAVMVVMVLLGSTSPPDTNNITITSKISIYSRNNRVASRFGISVRCQSVFSRFFTNREDSVRMFRYYVFGGNVPINDPNGGPACASTKK